MRLLVSLAWLAAVLFVSSACAPGPEPIASGRPASGVRTPPPTPDVAAQADAATFGRWRPAPIRPSTAVAAAGEAACRTRDEVAALPLRVLDARGVGLLTMVFADDASAVLCRAEVAEDGSATAEARPVAGYGPKTGTPEEGTLGIHDLEVLQSSSGARTVVVGQVGDGVHSVGVNFDDATWSTAAMAGGWYATWWPGTAKALGVAASDLRSVVMDSYAP